MPAPSSPYSPQAGGAFLPGSDMNLTGQVGVTATAQALTATGATGGAGTALSVITPAVATLTGASGSAIDIPTGAGVPGAIYMVRNINATGVINIFAVGGTIDGTTGTTALALSPTGTKAAVLFCSAAGVWNVAGISTT